jgi:hypothetical protein
MKKQAFILLFLIGNLALGQQLPLYSQYLYNKFLINPAVAGSDGYTSFNLTAREQWIGFSGAPRTVSFSMQTKEIMLLNKPGGTGRFSGQNQMGKLVLADTYSVIRTDWFKEQVSRLHMHIISGYITVLNSQWGLLLPAIIIK